jgi:hypothetical protein
MRVEGRLVTFVTVSGFVTVFSGVCFIFFSCYVIWRAVALDCGADSANCFRAVLCLNSAPFICCCAAAAGHKSFSNLFGLCACLYGFYNL